MSDETKFDVLAKRGPADSAENPDTDFDFSAMDKLCAARQAAEEKAEPHSCAIDHDMHTSLSAERAEPQEPGSVDPAMYGWSADWPEEWSEDATERYAQAKIERPDRQASVYILGGVGGAAIAFVVGLHMQSKPVVITPAAASAPVVVMPSAAPPSTVTVTPRPTETSDFTQSSEADRDSDFIGSLAAKGMRIVDRPAVVRSGHTACSLLGSAKHPSMADVATMLVGLYGWSRTAEENIVASAGNVYCPDLI